MGLIHQLKALRKRLTSLRQKEFCPQTIFRYELQYQLFSGSPACQPTLQILDLPACTTVLANSLKSISLSLSYMRTCNIMCCIYMRETHFLDVFLRRRLLPIPGCLFTAAECSDTPELYYFVSQITMYMPLWPSAYTSMGWEYE